MGGNTVLNIPAYNTNTAKTHQHQTGSKYLNAGDKITIYFDTYQGCNLVTVLKTS